jgi:carbon monoxide dehydrogenase subunit G
VIKVERTFDVAQPVDVIVGYLTDFAHAEQWDPGTKSCRREGDGPVGVGATWHNVSEIRGHETELTYELVRADPDHITLVGKNKGATSTDDITVVPAPGGGSTITYRAEIDFHGLAKAAQPFLGGEFERLGDETQESMTRVLESLD